jgi:hypothetical protein
MVTTRTGKSSYDILSSSEHELENSPQIESQHGTHRGAEGGLDRNGSELDMDQAHVSLDANYMQPEMDGNDRFLTPSVCEEKLRVSPQSRRTRQTRSACESDDEEELDPDLDVEAMLKMFTKLLRCSGKAKRDSRSGSRVEQRVLATSPRRGASSASDLMYANIALSGIKLPKLESKLFLENHLDRINSILGEMNLLSDGLFDPKFKHRLMAIVSDSLSGVSEVSRAFDDLDRYGHDWAEIRKSLLSQFCSRAALRFTLKDKLNVLKFAKPYNKFINDVKEIYYIHKRFYSDSGEVGSLVRKVIEVLPNYISRPIVKEMVSINEDWEHAFPFDQFLKKVEASLVVPETCESVIPHSKGHDSRSNLKGKVAAVREGKKDWLEDWVKSKDGVLYCCGPQHRDEVLQAAKDNARLEVKTFDKGKNGPYALVGYSGKNAPSFQCSSRPFVLRTKN